MFDNIAVFSKTNSNSDLAFVIPYDKEDSSFRSRVTTATKWCGGEVETTRTNYENGFVSGYKLSDISTRYRTSASHFQLQHPAGFEFQIPAENFFKLVMAVYINKGVISTPLKLVRYNSENFLAWEESTVFVELKEIEERSKREAKKAAEARKENPYLKITDFTKLQFVQLNSKYSWIEKYGLFIPELEVRYDRFSAHAVLTNACLVLEKCDTYYGQRVTPRDSVYECVSVPGKFSSIISIRDAISEDLKITHDSLSVLIDHLVKHELLGETRSSSYGNYGDDVTLEQVGNKVIFHIIKR